MKCREFVEFLMEYLDGALAEQERSVFEGHIEDCPACVNYLATYRETGSQYSITPTLQYSNFRITGATHG